MRLLFTGGFITVMKFFINTTTEYEWFWLIQAKFCVNLVQNFDFYITDLILCKIVK
jgi:hypothetical protein